MIATNELPSLADASAALSSRFVILRMTRSFYGNEDHGLTDRLPGELPRSCCGRSMAWTHCAHEGGCFQPKSGAELVDELEALGIANFNVCP
ncbi:MAG: hypothetical protein IPO95_08780 [Rhodanobacteraceae bacterium]|nr:hypothetical protein [Rhodanobacteraceae bacterium]